MNAATSKFNLRPQERRLVAFVAIVLFVVLNIWLVWPHFGDWGAIRTKQERAKKSYETFQAEIAKMAAYRVKLRELEKAGQSVVPEEQELDLVRTVDSQARLNRLNVITSDPRPRVGSLTNRFFEEQYQTLHVTSGNEELVNFLVSLTSTNSLIRIKDLTVKPDHGGTKLDGQMTLVASYQRMAPARSQPSSPSPVTTTTSSKKPASPPRVAAATNKTTIKPSTTAPAPKVTNRVSPPTMFSSSKPRPTNAPAKKF